MADLNLTAAVDLMIAGVAGDAQAQRELQEMVNKAVVAGGQSGLKTLSKESNELFTALNGAGLKSAANAFVKVAKKSEEREQMLLRQKARLALQLQRATADADKKRFQKQIAAKDLELKKEKQFLTRKHKLAEKAAKRRQAMIDQYEEARNRTAQERAQSFGDTAGKAISGSVNLGDMNIQDALGGALGALGGGARLAGGAAGSAGMAGTAAALGTAAAGIAAVAGPLIAIAGLMAMAYGQAKEMNKSLMQSASAFDIVGAGATQYIQGQNGYVTELEHSLEGMRKTILDLGNQFRMSKEEITGVVNGLNEAGITFREMSDLVGESASNMEAFGAVTRTALLASQGLGVEASAIGDFMNKLSRDMGENLHGIEGAFGLIASEAAGAKMRTSDFFSAINEASSGMALYNFRINDTVVLMGKLVEILGEDLAKTRIGASGSFRSMGTQERYKQSMLSGGRMQAIAIEDAKAQAREFSGNMTGKARIGLGNRGLLGAGGDVDPAALSRMTGEAFRELLSSGDLTDVEERQLTSLRELSAAMKGDTTRAMGAYSQRGELAAELSQAQGFFGGKMLSEMSNIQRMAYEDMTGKSGDEFDQLMRIQEGLMADFEKAQREGTIEEGTTFEQALINGLIGSEEEIAERGQQTMTMIERNAADTLIATRSISTVLKNKIASILEEINGSMGQATQFLSYLAGKLGGGDDDEQQERQRQISVYNQGVKTAGLQIGGMERARNELQGQLAGVQEQMVGAQGQELETLKAREAELEREVKIANRRVNVATEARANFVQGGFDGAEGRTWDQFLRSAKNQGVQGVGGDTLQAYRRLGEQFRQTSTIEQGYIDEKGFDPQLLGSLVEKLADGGGAALSHEEAQTLEEQRALADSLLAEEEAAKIAQEKEAEAQLKATEDLAPDIASAIEKEGRGQKMLELLQLIDDSGTTLNTELMNQIVRGEAGSADVQRYLQGVGEGASVTAYEAALARGLGFAEVSPKAAVQDFIYRGDGTRGAITPINSADELIYGMKPGGAISKAAGRGSGKTVVVNISGGDEMRVYNIVRRVLSETGYGDTKQYS